MLKVVGMVDMEGNKEVSENAYVCNSNNNRFAVIDGESGYGPFSGKDAATIVQKYLNHKDYLDVSLKQGLMAANKELRQSKRGNSIWEYFSDISKDIRNCCSVAAIQVRGNQLQYIQTGSSMIFVQYRNGNIRSLTYDHTAKFQEKCIENQRKLFMQLKKGLKKNYSQKKLAECYEGSVIMNQPYHMECREKINTYEGYGAIDGSRESSNFWDSGSTPLMDIKQILLVTNGLRIPSHKYPGQETWMETAKHMFKKGPKSAYTKITKMEKDDPFCLQYLRVEQSDDKTAILLEVLEE